MLRRVVRRLLGRGTGASYQRRIALLGKGNVNRVLAFQHYFTLIKNVPGDLVECGVGEGYGLCLLKHYADLNKRTGRIWAFDSFAGFPPLSDQDRRGFIFEEGLKEYEQFTEAFVHTTLVNYGHAAADVAQRFEFVKGFIPDTLKFYEGGPVAFCHLDLDIYEPYRDALAYFWGKMAPGGVIAFDEYLKPMDVVKWPGASKAIKEFVDANGLQIQWNELSNNPYLVKR